MPKTTKTNQPAGAVLARRRCAARRRDKITTEGRRLDLLLPAEPAAALARLERESGEPATRIIARLIVEAGGRE